MVDSGFIPNDIFRHLFLLKHLSYSQFKCLSVTCGISVVFSTNKTDRHNITEILLKMVLNTINHSTNLNTVDDHNLLQNFIHTKYKLLLRH